MLFDNRQQSNLDACVEMIEQVIAHKGVDPTAARIKSQEGPAWALKRGSAKVFVFLSSVDGENFLQVIAPIMRPTQGAEKLYLRLLELNANDLTSAAFGVRDGDVVLTADRSTAGLDQVEVEEMIRRVGEYADHYDDALTAEFGGTRHADRK